MIIRIENEFRSLRYGRLLIVADADVDGKHIAGLVMNIFDYLYPSLLKRGFVQFLRTPIIRAVKGKQSLPFFTQSRV